jgi:hypothetical protein
MENQKGQVLHAPNVAVKLRGNDTWCKAIDAFSASVTRLQSFASLRKELE